MRLASTTHGPLWLTGAAHFAILLIAIQLESPAMWPWALLAMAVISFFAWITNHRRYRQIHDLPTSKIASAAQGYVELLGRSRLLDGTPILSRLCGLPCCWYRYQIEELNEDDRWQIIDQGSSIAHFLLIDDTGACVISPEGAEIVTRDHRTWREGHYRNSEWLLLPGSVLYALGEFTTRSGHVGGPADERADIAALIADWKHDQTALHRRFDLNQDGAIDRKEWELARLQAAREVRKQHAQQSGRLVEGVHLLRKPQDGRLFLLASEMPDTLGRRYRLWSLFHLAFLIAVAVGGLILGMQK